jgi:hypothetical protein
LRCKLLRPPAGRKPTPGAEKRSSPALKPRCQRQGSLMRPASEVAMQTIFAQGWQRLPGERGTRLCVLATGAMQPISGLGIRELRIGNWESEMETQFRHSLFAFRNRVPQNQRDGENGFSMRVCASNAIHPAMMCSLKPTIAVERLGTAAGPRPCAAACKLVGIVTPTLNRAKACGILRLCKRARTFCKLATRSRKPRKTRGFFAMPTLQTHEAVPG